MLAARIITIASLAALAAAGCGVDTSQAGASAAVPTGSDPGAEIAANEAFPEDRCAANEAAGTITFLANFDLAAAASIVDVIVADDAGYFDAVCLDVAIQPGSSSNFAEVAAQNAAFASAGSFSDVVSYSGANEADLLVTTVDGRTTIDTLIVKSGEATELRDLAGQSIGVQGGLPPAIDVMLRRASLVEGTDFETVHVDGSGPIDDLGNEAVVGVCGWKSNEVGTLERAGIGVQLFDPLDFGVPGSFGVIYTSAAFIEQHPTAAQDFVRAAARGLADAVADPAAAAATAIAALELSRPSNSWSPDSEIYRWETEARLILEGTPEGTGLGTPDLAALQAELDAYAEVGFFGDRQVPDASEFVAAGLSNGIHDDAGTVIWPS